MDINQLAARPLVELPAQPTGVPWPVDEWPQDALPHRSAVEPLIDEMFGGGPFGVTYAVVVVQRGRLVFERYAGELEHWDRPNERVDASTRLLSWSMAKSMLHAVVGLLVGDGRLSVSDRADVPEWSAPGDPRGAIRLDDLLAMRDGLDFTEDYVDAGVSDVIEMLFGAGQDDVAHFAADRPLIAEPGTRFNYSSGTSNIVSGIVRRSLGGRAAYEQFLQERLFGRLSMGSAIPTFDGAGTWIGSSYVHATARDYARFGLLYLRDGVWNGRRVLPDGWVDYGRAVRSVDDKDGRLYGSHWWAFGDEHGTFWASGYDGQQIVVCPALDLIVVRLGKTSDPDNSVLVPWHKRFIAALADGAG